MYTSNADDTMTDHDITEIAEATVETWGSCVLLQDCSAIIQRNDNKFLELRLRGRITVIMRYHT